MVDVLIYRLNYTQASVTVQKSITWLEHQFWQWIKFGSLEQDSLAWYNVHINLFVLSYDSILHLHIIIQLATDFLLECCDKNPMMFS